MVSVRSTVGILLVACSAAGAPVPTGRIDGHVTLVSDGKPRADAGNVAVWI